MSRKLNRSFKRNTFVSLLFPLLLILLSSSRPVSGLPFTFRGQSTQSSSSSEDDDDSNDSSSNNNKNKNKNAAGNIPAANLVMDAEIDGNTGIPTFHINPTNPGGRRNPIVESFFADTAHSTTAHSTTASKKLSEEIYRKANEIYDFLVYSRRSLHQHPELMYQEEITSSYVQKVLSELDISYSTGWGVNTVPDRISGPGGYGVVADIGTGEAPCVLLRADMDALPIYERTENIDFQSRYSGKMQ
jgi:hypothetical protein